MLKFDDNFVCQNIISLWELKVCYFDSHRWVIEVIGAPGTLYANETYKLQVDFPEHYPMEAPQVVNLAIGLRVFFTVSPFCGSFPLTSVVDGYSQVIFMNPAPMHPHIYSNGHICLGMRFTLCFKGEQILRGHNFTSLCQ
jgi:hypothetical protein